MACEVSTVSLAKYIAVTEMALSISNFGALTFNMALITLSPQTLINLIAQNPNANKDLEKFLELQKPVQIATLLLLMLLCVIGFGLGMLLLHGSKEGNSKQLRTWRLATASIYILCIPIYVMWLVYTEDVRTLVVSFIVIYFFGGFSFYVVHILIYEIDIRVAEEMAGLVGGSRRRSRNPYGYDCSGYYIHNTV